MFVIIMIIFIIIIIIITFSRVVVFWKMNLSRISVQWTHTATQFWGFSIDRHFHTNPTVESLIESLFTEMRERSIQNYSLIYKLLTMSKWFLMLDKLHVISYFALIRQLKPQTSRRSESWPSHLIWSCALWIVCCYYSDELFPRSFTMRKGNVWLRVGESRLR